MQVLCWREEAVTREGSHATKEQLQELLSPRSSRLRSSILSTVEGELKGRGRRGSRRCRRDRRKPSPSKLSRVGDAAQHNTGGHAPDLGREVGVRFIPFSVFLTGLPPTRLPPARLSACIVSVFGCVHIQSQAKEVSRLVAGTR
jgi:hypothetical protein